MAIIDCKDPVFLGTEVYTTLGFAVRKLSRLQECRQLPDGGVVFDTPNNTYLATFTDDLTRDTFLRTCATIGRLEVVT